MTKKVTLSKQELEVARAALEMFHAATLDALKEDLTAKERKRDERTS